MNGHWTRSLATVLAAACLIASGPAPVIVLFDDSNPPLAYATEEGYASGLYPAIAREAFARMGLPVACLGLPWTRALDKARKGGEGGICGLYKNTAREAYLDYSAPVFRESLAVYHRAGEARYATLADLRGKTVGVMRGWSYGEEFDGERDRGAFAVEENRNDEQNFQKLRSGRIDAMLAETHSGDALIVELGLEGAVERESPLMTLDVYLAFNKAERKGDLIARFDETLRAMREDGTMARLEREALDSRRYPAIR